MAAPPARTRPRVLFLARRYPPSVGGIETHCRELYQRLAPRAPTRLLALGRGSLVHLAWFLPLCLVWSAWLLLWRRVDVVYFSDGVAAALAPLLRPFRPSARFVTTVYGLELRYGQALARRLMVGGIRACDRVVVISQNTRDLALGQGVRAERMEVVHLGVDPPELAPAELERLRQDFGHRHGLRWGEQRILLNFGRQVARKGVAEFIARAMPLLPADVHLVVGGTGPELPHIRTLAERPPAAGRVHVLGLVPDAELAMLRASADLFVMPNIALPRDVEGFGQTQLECMYSGTPAVAFAVDALPESIRAGGYLVPPGEYEAFAAQIQAFYALSPELRRAKQEEARDYVRSQYSWDRTADRYLCIFAATR